MKIEKLSILGKNSIEFDEILTANGEWYNTTQNYNDWKKVLEIPHGFSEWNYIATNDDEYFRIFRKKKDKI